MTRFGRHTGVLERKIRALKLLLACCCLLDGLAAGRVTAATLTDARPGARLSAPRLTPRPSSLDSLDDDLKLEGLEVIQVIQDLKNTVPLVAERPTLVRAYLGTESDDDHTVVVKGQLLVRKINDAGEVVHEQSFPSRKKITVDPFLNGKTQDKREDLENSLNFDLPSTAVRQGRYRFLLRVQRNSTGAELSCGNCGEFEQEVHEFFEVRPFKVMLIGFLYMTRNPNSDQDSSVTIIPGDQDFKMIRSWLKRAFPVSHTPDRFVVSHKIVPADRTWTVPFACGVVNSKLDHLRRLDINGGSADPDTRYIGVISDGGSLVQTRGFMEGCADLPVRPDASASGSLPTGVGPVRSAEIDWDKDGVYGDWYTGHELAHTFGRRHPGKCTETQEDDGLEVPGIGGKENTFIGYDVGDGDPEIREKLLLGNSNFDLMTYCGHNWMSAYTYKAIFDALKVEAETASSAGPTATPSPVSPAMTQPVSSSGPGLTLLSVQQPARSTANTPAGAPLAAAAAALRTPQETTPGVTDPPPAPTPTPDATLPGSAPSGGPVELPGDNLQEERLTTGEFLTIVARVDLTERKGELLFPSPVSQAEAKALGASDESALSYPLATVKLKGKDNTLLGEYSFPLVPSSSRSSAHIMSVNGLVPFHPECIAIELYLVGDGRGDTTTETEVARLEVTGQTPQVQNLNILFRGPDGGNSACRFFEATWVPRSQYKSRVLYNVELSKNGGRTWSTLATDLQEQFLCFHPKPPAGEDMFSEVRLRVTIKDGIRSSRVVRSFTLNAAQRDLLAR